MEDIKQELFPTILKKQIMPVEIMIIELRI